MASKDESKDEMLRRPIQPSSPPCAVEGAAALAVIGFTWGGWVTGSKTNPLARQQVQTTLVAADAFRCREVQGSGAWQTDGRRRSKRSQKATDNGVGRVSVEPLRTTGCRNLNKARELAP